MCMGTASVSRQCLCAQEKLEGTEAELGKKIALLEKELADTLKQHEAALRQACDAAEQDKQRFVERTDEVRSWMSSPLMDSSVRGAPPYICERL